MIELLIVCLIMLMTNLLFLNPEHDFKMGDYRFYNAYNLAKSEAMKNHQRVDLVNCEDLNIRYPIYFSKNGNVNKAQTIIGHKHHMIIHLGNGYLKYEN